MSAGTVELPLQDVLELLQEEGSARAAAMDRVRPCFVAAEDETDDASWQIVEIACDWMSPSGEQVRRVSAHLLIGTRYVLIGDVEHADGGPESTEPRCPCTPVPSIRAGETMLHTLPASHEVGAPRPRSARVSP